MPIVDRLENRRQELAFIFNAEHRDRLTLIYLICGSYCELLRIKNHMVAFSSDRAYGIRKDMKVSFESSDHQVELKKKVPEIVYSRKNARYKTRQHIIFISRRRISFRLE